MNIATGFQDTRVNNEDMALTPYLFLVKAKAEKTTCLGIGLCWIYYAAFIGVYWGSNFGWIHLKAERNDIQRQRLGVQQPTKKG